MITSSLQWTREILSTAGELRESDLFGGEQASWYGASIDSREDCDKKLFFALKGGRTDGHRFVGSAASMGSSAVVVDQENAAKQARQLRVPFYLVNDTLRALQELSRAYRNTLTLRVVAITGSAGKTTTKEFIRIILKKKYRVYCSPGNYNNHIGVPLTLLATGPEAEYLIAEVAANHVGEIDFLSELLRPDIGVITNIGDAHIGLFGGRDRIAEAKSELFSGIEKDGYAVLPADDDYIDLLSERSGCRRFTFGYAESSTFRVSSVKREGDRISFEINGELLAIKSVGTYNVLNAAAAVAVGELCGIDVQTMRHALAEFEPLSGRARTYHVGGVVVIDDSYNANPTSMRVSLDAFKAQPAQRHIAILGDMAELGEFTEEAHRDMGEFISRLSLDRVYWVGCNGQHVAAGMRDSAAVYRSLPAVDDLLDSFADELTAGDTVLIKASRASGLDRLVERLLKDLERKESDN